MLTLRVTDLVQRLDWEKSRVSHLLTRMESRGFIERTERGAAGRRSSCTLSDQGRAVIEAAERVHERTVRARFLDRLSPEQRAAILECCEQLLAADLPTSGSR
ncbi:DNA-binding MarR family transcriptional regulator [Friedmanniella endophytica]|uniref:DNA-binding MarR family transcriptional regulator n=1 Tax=Microlunatus kandeliicorticis TaxID=1759536 RepID=A0A7W3P6A0_9ACTN|nr:MarR family transcriptional regulator [Microlunatus kandeliicorticis]MBA8794742.1 DNA-binding MarR family transcriptional regulator [Microlunatus kandeliicorticis]